jgi:hypothetical protein
MAIYGTAGEGADGLSFALFLFRIRVKILSGIAPLLFAHGRFRG